MMKLLKQNLAIICAAATLTMVSASQAHAQSTEEGVGAIIGGTAGAIIGGEVDKKGSKVEGQVIGAIIGGSLGYVIGGELEKDRELRRRYDDRSGEYYVSQGKPYRRYQDSQYGYVSIPISNGDPYYYLDGRKKSHPVFAEHPGQGRGKGLKKNKKFK